MHIKKDMKEVGGGSSNPLLITEFEIPNENAAIAVIITKTLLMFKWNLVSWLQLSDLILIIIFVLSEIKIMYMICFVFANLKKSDNSRIFPQ